MLLKVMADAAARTKAIASALTRIKSNIHEAHSQRSPELGNVLSRLVAVSKTKPASDILAAYQVGQRHFGENYLNEIEEKSKDERILEQCPDIKWHYIGNLQRNKVKKLLRCPGLYMVETVDSERLAGTLNSTWSSAQPRHPLNVMVQVNSSREDQKGGVMPEHVVSLVDFLRSHCPALCFCGLMTIGSLGWPAERGPNPDFVEMVRCRRNLCSELGLPEADVELSMGMSADYQHAVEMGSTSVRVGSILFGSRPPLKGASSSDGTSASASTPDVAGPQVSPSGRAGNQGDQVAAESSTLVESLATAP